MALTDFFRINMPYGMERNENGGWYCFNREYKPLGYNTRDNVEYSSIPIATKYKGLSEKKLLELSDSKENSIRLDENGKIYKVWFYSDGTNPHSFPSKWNQYATKLKTLSKLKIKK